MIFLLVKLVLFARRDVAMVMSRHRPFLGTRVLVATMLFLRALRADFVLTPLLLDTFVLVREAVIHLVTTPMCVVPRALRPGGAAAGQQPGKRKGEMQTLDR
ncbi:MAG TPA: hypothetical protein VGM32_11455, partial [Rhodopila sp.]